MRKDTLLFGLAVLLSVAGSAARGTWSPLTTYSPSSSRATPATPVPPMVPVAGSGGITSTGEIAYLDDGHVANRCGGPSSILHYVVFSPSSPGPHPVVFGMQGSGFVGAATCDPTSHLERYRLLDPVMQQWAKAGYVAVNLEYHGSSDGLFGDLTYPGDSSWGNAADGTVDIDIKPAINHFFAHHPDRYGADEGRGVVAFGTSSGGHNASMLGITGVPGHRIDAVVGWSGLPDAAASSGPVQQLLDWYMRTSPGSDVEAFADPYHRFHAGDAPEYIANGKAEFIDPRNAVLYGELCGALAISCWTRIPDTNLHANDYAQYRFTGTAAEQGIPPVEAGTTVMADSLAFTARILGALTPRPTDRVTAAISWRGPTRI